MPEHGALVDAYQHLENLPRAADALHTLRKVSSLVKPLMRKRNWRVSVLKEFFPEQINLMGLNVDRGRSICLRLRHASDSRQFLPLEDIVDTMLHELSHNVHGPHDEKFHKLWNELRDEYMDLKLKGFSGEGFLSDGHRLGGRSVPIHELRRNARAEAEKRKARQNMHKGSGQKLGGQSVLRGLDMRDVIADAVVRRINITTGCASGTVGADEVSQDADRNGFKTKAEEDDANDRAIIQALWELIQEEEARSVGVEPQQTSLPLNSISTNTKCDNGKGDPDVNVTAVTSGSDPPNKLRIGGSHLDSLSNPTSLHRTGAPKPEARLLSVDEAERRSPAHLFVASPERQTFNQFSTTTMDQLSGSSLKTQTTWSCGLCTFENPIQFLCCDACGGERPRSPITKLSSEFVGSADCGPVIYQKLPRKMGWNCLNCGSWHDHQWWTCSNCGLLKSSSA